MPATFHVSMPDVAQRQQIIRLILDNEPIADDVDIEVIAKCSDGFSGSDLREVCRNAAVYRIRDFLKEEITQRKSHTLRPITMDDLKFSLTKMRKSKRQCDSLNISQRIDLD